MCKIWLYRQNTIQISKWCIAFKTEIKYRLANWWYWLTALTVYAFQISPLKALIFFENVSNFFSFCYNVIVGISKFPYETWYVPQWEIQPHWNLVTLCKFAWYSFCLLLLQTFH